MGIMESRSSVPSINTLHVGERVSPLALTAMHATLSLLLTELPRTNETTN